jgi:sterol desaturase/sphingolipid hydroxylase (fatty acid hydroxylase superfamily)
VPLERLFALHSQPRFRKQFAVDLGYYFLNGLLPGLLLGGPMAVIALASHWIIPGAITAAIGAWPMWLRACAAMVVGETGYYWGHRWTHQSPFLWRFHSIHHSAEALDFLVNNRAHPVDMVFSRLCMLTPLFALGLVNPMRVTDGAIPVAILVTGSLWGYFIHSNLRWRLGPLEWLVTTPGFHHWHHTNGGKRRDCNYASMLPWLDRVFGTHYLPKEWPARYGIEEPMAGSLIGQLLSPLQEPGARVGSVQAVAAPQGVTQAARPMDAEST